MSIPEELPDFFYLSMVFFFKLLFQKGSINKPALKGPSRAYRPSVVDQVIMCCTCFMADR